MSTKAIAIIPARGGSKRIPSKNIALFHTKPLIAYSIETALNSKLFERVIVSTDDEKIAKTAKEYGAEVPSLRPEKLSDDFTGTAAVVNYVLEQLKKEGYTPDFCCTLYATAPFLQVKYLIEGFNELQNSDATIAFSVTSMPFPIQRTFKITKEKRCEMFTPEHFSSRSQDLETAYQDAGQFYWENLHNHSDEITFSQTSIPIVIPRHLVQDIDTLEDFKRAELMYAALEKL